MGYIHISKLADPRKGPGALNGCCSRRVQEIALRSEGLDGLNKLRGIFGVGIEVLSLKRIPGRGRGDCSNGRDSCQGKE